MKHTGINKKNKTSDTLKSLDKSQKHYAKCRRGRAGRHKELYIVWFHLKQSRRGKSIRSEKRAAISRNWEWKEGINFKGP